MLSNLFAGNVVHVSHEIMLCTRSGMQGFVLVRAFGALQEVGLQGCFHLLLGGTGAGMKQSLLETQGNMRMSELETV